MNTFGVLLRLTTFGESHGPAMGGVLDGFVPGMKVDMEYVGRMMARRRPGNGMTGTSARREEDIPEFLSGISPDGITLGTPIGFIIRNKDSRSTDYEEMRHIYRPNHADYTYDMRYGIRDWRGGGRASARETVSRVVAGALCRQWLSERGIEIEAEYEETGTVAEIATQGDSIGGFVRCRIIGLKAGIGNPVAGKLHAELGAAMLSINAVKAFEYGDGVEAARMRGSESADSFTATRSEDGPRIYTVSNHSGGVQGGISNGMPVEMRITFKATPTIMQPLATVDDEGHPVNLRAKGRHDACVAIRAVPVVEAMAALVVMDQILRSNAGKNVLY